MDPADNDRNDIPAAEPIPAASAIDQEREREVGAEMVTVDTLGDIRGRIVPMFEVVAAQYQGRVPAGFPHVINDTARGLVGLEIDANYALYISTEDDGIYADIYRRDPRTDNRSGASREKYAGQPFHDHRLLDPNMSDQALRNLISEVMSHFNMQPGLLYITDD